MLYNIGLLWNTAVEREEIKEAETHKELEEVTGQSDPLNLIFSYFDSRFQEIENEIRKSKDKEPAEKKRKIQVETFKQKDHRLQHESNLDIMEDLQDIIGNISDKQDPVSTLFKAVISKLKKRKKINWGFNRKGLGSCSRVRKGADWEADYCFGCGKQGHSRWTYPKRKQSYHRRENKI